MQQINNPFKWGMQQAVAYYPFLMRLCPLDVEQEIRLAVLQCDPNKDRKLFNNQVNRNLYSLARAFGYRKRHMNEDTSQGWWTLPTRHLSALDEKRFVV